MRNKIRVFWAKIEKIKIHNLNFLGRTGFLIFLTAIILGLIGLVTSGIYMIFNFETSMRLIDMFFECLIIVTTIAGFFLIVTIYFEDKIR